MATIVTYLTYSELFKYFQRNGLTLLFSSLKTTEDFETQIEYLLREVNPIELIQFTSFLNMICQTRTTEMTMVRGVTLLEESGVVPKGTGFSNKIFFHRENLLNLIGQILFKDIAGTDQLTGVGHTANQKKYSEAILLNNDLINVEVGGSAASAKETVLRNHFVREWPHYYLLDIAHMVYGHRLTRYRYCYETLLPTLQETDRLMMEEGIRVFQQKTGVSLKEYMKVVTGLFAWYFEIPYQYLKNPPAAGQLKLGFDFLNINSFYIDAGLFEKDPSFIKTIDAFSRNINDLKTAIAQEGAKTRDPITGYNKYARVFFDNPVFKISDEYYCVVDLKFLIENACGGLLWRLAKKKNLQNFKSAYGRLMEEYFKFLIQNIFKDAEITFGGMVGVDAIVEQGDKVFVIEFTTEYYRLSSLYNPTSEQFLNDAYRLLFNTGGSDPRARDKRDRGKLIKLNEYIEKNQGEGKIIVPVLVTENLLGNPDLFNDFGNFYDKEVADKKLAHIKQNPPLFLCLDDLETFWAFFDPKDAVEGFATFAKEWVGTDKGPHFHNASAGITKFVEKQHNGEARISNHDFANFFAPKETFKE